MIPRAAPTPAAEGRGPAFPWATLAWVGMLIAVGLLADSWGGLDYETTVQRMGAFTPGLLDSQPWRLLSSHMLHWSWSHLLNNCLLLAMSGFVVEGALGWRGLLSVAAIATLTGSIGALALPMGGLAAGASATAAGVLGACIAVDRVPRTTPSWRRFRLLGFVVSGLGLALLVNVAFEPGIGNGAHLLGLVGGAAAGGAIASPGSEGERRRAATWRWARGLLLALLLSQVMAIVTGGAWTLDRPPTDEGRRLPPWRSPKTGGPSPAVCVSVPAGAPIRASGEDADPAVELFGSLPESPFLVGIVRHPEAGLRRGGALTPRGERSLDVVWSAMIEAAGIDRGEAIPPWTPAPGGTGSRFSRETRVWAGTVHRLYTLVQVDDDGAEGIFGLIDVDAPPAQVEGLKASLESFDVGCVL